MLYNFNPRFPRGKRRFSFGSRPYSYSFQSTLPAGEATPMTARSTFANIFQSTLPAGEATRGRGIRFYQMPISIHASRGGSDSLRSRLWRKEWRYFNPRFPRGKRPEVYRRSGRRTAISIHASRGGSDLLEEGESPYDHGFQSTLPAGEATACRNGPVDVLVISIHASRGGSDDTMRGMMI